MANSISSPRVLAVIPARFASTRFPGKIIAPLMGKPLVAHAYARAVEATLVEEALVATDNEQVAAALAPYDIPVVMTRVDHACGTDRIAEVMAASQAEIVVNVQGDEPLVDPRTIDATIQPLLDDPDLVMATARRAITDPAKRDNPNVVKVISDSRGRAIYFSRQPIPHIRDEVDRHPMPACYWEHVGLYVYRREFLLAYAKMAQTPLEKLEMLEQLRVLENGYDMAVVTTDYEAIGVDTPEDLAEVERKMRAAQEEG